MVKGFFYLTNEPITSVYCFVNCEGQYKFAIAFVKTGDILWVTTTRKLKFLKDIIVQEGDATMILIAS